MLKERGCDNFLNERAAQVRMVFFIFIKGCAC